METKHCSKCNLIFPLESFYLAKHHKDGRVSQCRLCKREYVLKRLANNKKLNKNRIVLFTELTCCQCHLTKPIGDFYRNSTSNTGFRNVCKACAKQYTFKNRAKIMERVTKWIKENPEKHRAYARKTHKKLYERNKQNPFFRLSNNMRSYIWYFLKGNKNGSKWQDIVGYSIIELKNRLEVQFQKGMTWNNYGKWHIDHIRPISSFNFTTFTDSEFKKCWSLKNLQPLWASDNVRKKDKII